MKIYWNSPDFREFRSTLIFCDEEGDEEPGFLPPVVRFFTWNRRQDRENHPWWPTASLEVRRIVDEDAIQPLVTRLQAAYLEIGFAPSGLNTRRDYPDWDTSEGDLRLYMEMGLQNLGSRCQHVEVGIPVSCARPLWAAARAVEEAARHSQ